MNALLFNEKTRFTPFWSHEPISPRLSMTLIQSVTTDLSAAVFAQSFAAQRSV
jgi:hypothetical protein